MYTMQPRKFKDKNLFFYRNQDKLSMAFLQELNKNLPLKRQFIIIDMEDKKIRVPPDVAEIPTTPILIVSGNGCPIVGKDAMIWISNNGFSESANMGIEYWSMAKSSNVGAFLDDKRTMELGGPTFAPISGADSIDTFKDRDEDPRRGVKVSAKEREFKSKLDAFKDERNKDLIMGKPKAVFGDRMMPMASREVDSKW
jgi:hypothetical protein